MAGTPITNGIRRLRFDTDEMTQQQLAHRVGVTRQSLILRTWKYHWKMTDMAA